MLTYTASRWRWTNKKKRKKKNYGGGSVFGPGSKVDFTTRNVCNNSIYHTGFWNFCLFALMMINCRSVYKEIILNNFNYARSSKKWKVNKTEHQNFFNIQFWCLVLSELCTYNWIMNIKAEYWTKLNIKIFWCSVSFNIQV